MPFQSEAQRGYMYSKHPKIAERFEEETPEDADLPEHVQHLYGGTDSVGGFDVDMGDSTTVRGLPLTTPPPSMPTLPAPPPAPAFNPSAGLPPAAAPPSPAPPVAPAFNELTPYLEQQRASLDKYGPEQQMAVEQEIAKRRGSFGQVAGNAMTGLADALMQGVARAGSSNFQANLQNRNDKTEAGIRGAMERAQTGNLAKVKQEMELSQMDPSSQLSKMAQRAYGATLKNMPGGQNLTDAQIAMIPASSISDILSKKVDLAKVIADFQQARDIREQNLLLHGQDVTKQKQDQIIKAAQDSIKTLNPANPLDHEKWLQAKRVLEKAARGEDVTQGEVGAPPKYIQNEQGHTMVSHDGGVTWGEIK